MSKDYYKILGVEKNASQDDIKKAFRKLAHEYHPDKKGGDEAKFKEANEAYQILSNQQKRQQYDQFGSAGPGGQGFHGQNPFGQGFGGFDFSSFGGNGQGFQFDFGDQGHIDLDDILGSFFGGGGFQQRTPKGRDIRVSVTLTFAESILGTEKQISIPKLVDRKEQKENEQVTITIPAGVSHGQTLRVKGYGEHITNGRDGDALVEIHVIADKRFRREGMHIITDLSVPLSQAIEGGTAEVPYIDNTIIQVKIPAGLASGHILRVKNKGIPSSGFQKGDLYIKTNILIPQKITKNMKKVLELLKEDEGK